jgi:hypothetical protein
MAAGEPQEVGCCRDIKSREAGRTKFKRSLTIGRAVLGKDSKEDKTAAEKEKLERERSKSRRKNTRKERQQRRSTAAGRAAGRKVRDQQ